MKICYLIVNQKRLRSDHLFDFQLLTRVSFFKKLCLLCQISSFVGEKRVKMDKMYCRIRFDELPSRLRGFIHPLRSHFQVNTANLLPSQIHERCPITSFSWQFWQQLLTAKWPSLTTGRKERTAISLNSQSRFFVKNIFLKFK